MNKQVWSIRVLKLQLVSFTSIEGEIAKMEQRGVADSLNYQVYFKFTTR